MSMGKSLVVKQNEKVSNYDASKVISYRSCGPFRTTVCQFTVSLGKYAVVPVVDRSMSGYYKLKMYFNTEEANIKFHSELIRKTILSYGKQRSSLYTSTAQSNPLTKQIMTPYTLDSILNSKGSGELLKHKLQFEQKGEFYEDGATGSASANHKLVSSEQIQHTESSRHETILGIDAAATESAPELKSEVEQEILNELDLSYFYLTNDAFCTLLPVLENNHFTKIEKLNLKGNSIDDDSIQELCDTMIQVHNVSMSVIDLNETQITDKGILMLVDLMRRIFSITSVECSTLNLTAGVRSKLEAALAKNRVTVQDNTQRVNMFTAAKKMDEYKS